MQTNDPEGYLAKQTFAKLSQKTRSGIGPSLFAFIKESTKMDRGKNWRNKLIGSCNQFLVIASMYEYYENVTSENDYQGQIKQS